MIKPRSASSIRVALMIIQNISEWILIHVGQVRFFAWWKNRSAVETYYEQNKQQVFEYKTYKINSSRKVIRKSQGNN